MIMIEQKEKKNGAETCLRNLLTGQEQFVDVATQQVFWLHGCLVAV